MPPTRKDYRNTSGVTRKTADGVYYADGKYLCRRLENGIPCNREMAGTRRSINCHTAKFHKDGSYRQQMVRGQFVCIEDDCSHHSPTFPAILFHIRNKHGFRGSSNHLKIHYGISPGSNHAHAETKEKSGKESSSDVDDDDHEENPNKDHEEDHQEVESDNNAKAVGDSEDKSEGRRKKIVFKVIWRDNTRA